MKVMGIKERTIEEIITYINNTIADMDISTKDKMTILGMIVALGYKARKDIAASNDIKPMMRGGWIPKNADGSWRVDTCSVCKKDTSYVRYAPAYDYCPNCGAYMKEAKP